MPQTQIVFPNGQGTFNTSAQNPASMETIFQAVTAKIFGYTLTPTASAVSIASGGLGFAVGDLASINIATGSLLKVAAIGTGGAVVGLTLMDGGNCASSGTNLPTTTYTGTGTGLTVNVTAVASVPTTNDATNPFWAVRVGWQKQGQPAWDITQDIAAITAYTEDHPFSRVQDELYNPNDSESLVRNMGYTQVWRVHWTVYGPNAFTRAGIIVDGFSFDWVHDLIAAQSIYSVTEWKRPVVLYEEFQGQWWARADVDLKFNEQVNLSVIVPAAAGLAITLIKENNLNTTRNIDI